MLNTDAQEDPEGQPTARKGSKRLALALIWFLVAALWTPWGLNWLLGSGSIETTVLERAATLIPVPFVVLALVALLTPLTVKAAKFHTALAMAFVVAPALGECALRACLFAGVGELRDAKLFGDPYGDDDYWKLRKRWRKTVRLNPDSELGWVTPTTLRNPLGIVRPPGYEPTSEDVVLCFGDSFMAGLTPHPHKIPDALEEVLGGPTVYNFGVGGYGVGQMYLRFQQAHPKFEDPIIVVGILTRDLDRTILSVRGAAKPTFRVENDELVITPPKPSTTPENWREENPPEIRSYLLAMLVRRLHLNGSDGKADGLLRLRDEKRTVNGALLEAFVEEARANDLRLLFVTFPPSRSLGEPSWRDDFLKESFKRLEVPFIEGRKVLRQDMRKSKREAGDYFLPDNHPNELGNRVFAEAIAEKVSKLKKPKKR